MALTYCAWPNHSPLAHARGAREQQRNRCIHQPHQAVEPARLVVVPVVEQQTGVVEELPPDLAGGPGALGERHVSAQEVSPADLAAIHGPECQRGGPVAHQDASERAIERRERRTRAVGDDLEHRRRRRGDRPQREHCAGLEPGRAIGVLDRRAFDPLPCLGDWRLDGLGHTRFDRADRAERDRDTDEVR